MRRLLSWLLGPTAAGRIGSLLMLAGLVLVAYSLGAYLGLAPGGYTAVPEPVALAGSGQRSARLAPTPAEGGGEAAPPAPAASQPAPHPDIPDGARTAETQPAVPWASPSSVAAVEPTPARATTPEAVAEPAVDRKLDPADAADRLAAATAARPGPPVRLLLPSIEVDTEVKPGGAVSGPDGELEWETLPFVATTYPALGSVGSAGNAVISGHVVTLREGNVFRDLYRVELGDLVEVFTADSRFTYRVEEIKLVPPTAVEVMAPSEDARLTVITCGGTFDPHTRTFSDRLIVIGKLIGGERL